MAPPDQSPHVPRLLAAASLLLFLPRPLLSFLLLLTCSRMRLPYSLPRLSPAGPVLIPLSQSSPQSKCLPGTRDTYSQSSVQSKLLTLPGYAHTQSIGQSLQLNCLCRVFTEISSHRSLSSYLSFSYLSFSEFECE